ncbi:hypothetical protein ACFQ1M_15975 [Sungkyunkwania multivorans]|uniref:Secreted protein n=1 Tax=Sungkyunkwania multivorans TaxID=1173618 RepID=A0ABW3D0W8_9FLAO
MKKKVLNFLSITTMIILVTGCSNDDDCPDELIVDINDPESIERAEECGLSPAGPLGKSLWIYEIK